MEVVKRIDLDLSSIPKEKQEKVLNEVGGFVTNEILRHTARGVSPVEGEGQFQKLDKKYAKREKGGNTNPNLRLEGDLMDALDYRIVPSGIEVGVFSDSGEADKADGHNNFSGRSRLPKRRFIPDPSQNFVDKITKGINSIIEKNKSQEPEVRIGEPRVLNDESIKPKVSVSAIFSETSLDSFINRLFNGS